MKRIFLLVCGLVLGASVANADDDADISPFMHFKDSPGVLGLPGEINIRTPLAFRRALERYPDTNLLILHSPGGLVQSALLIAEEIHERKISTWILPEHECVSACSIIYFAGYKRVAQGKLGVHQMSGDADLEGVQLNLSDVLQALDKYGVSPAVITKMLRTGPDDMYYFSEAEKVSLGINRDQELNLTNAPSVTAMPTDTREVAESNARSFVLELIRRSTAEREKMLRYSSSVYANEVDFFGKRLSKTEVLRDKDNYSKRWPLRKSIPRADSIQTDCRNQYCQVSGYYDWEVRSPKRGKQLSGVAEFFYIIDMSDTNPRVIGEGGKVLSRR